MDRGLREGSLLLIVELLIGFRAEIVQRRMTSPPIAERLDVEEHVSLRLVARVIHTVMHQFALQRTEEALHRRIVVPTTDTVHTGLDAVVLKQRPIRAVGVLTALIRMVDQAGPGLTLTESHLQGVYGQATRHLVRHAPAHDAPGVQVQDGGQVQLSFLGRDVGDV